MELCVNLTVWDQADAFQRLREPWQALFEQCPDASSFLSWEWVSTWWHHFHDGRQAYIVTLSDGVVVQAIAPLLISRGGRRHVSFMGRDETTDYADILALAELRVEAAQAILEHLQSECARGASVTLEPLPEESPLLRAVELAAPDGLEIEPIQPCPTAVLASSWDAYLAQLTKKDRHELRRKLRRAETAGDLRYEIATEPGGLDIALEDFYRLHQSSRDPKKAQFLEPHLQAFFSDAATTFAERGWLRLSTLRLDGVAIASLLSFDRSETVYLYNSGLDPEYRRLSPGIILIAYELQAAIASGHTTYDFLRGDEAYKYDFGAKDRFVWRLCLGGRLP